MADKKNMLSDEATEKEKIKSAADYDDDYTSSADGTIFSADYEGEAGNTKKGKKRNNNGADKKRRISKPLIVVICAIAAVGILIGVYFFVQNMPSAPDSTSATYPTDENGEQYAVDLKGNKISAEKDGNGNIISAGVVELIAKVPADVKTINVSNESGEFTIHAETPTSVATNESGEEEVKTDATVYTLEGYEDADLKSGEPDAVASAAAAVTTTKIVDINGENPSEYGFDKPRANVKVTFTDNEEDTIKVGNKAPGEEGTYIQVNDDKAIYLVDNDSVSSFLLNPLALLDANITDSASSDENGEASKIIMGGSNFGGEEFVIVPNDDETNAAYYKITSPKKGFLSTDGYSAIGGILSLSGEAVVAYHPTQQQLEEYGVAKPVTTISAEYADVTYNLSASAPNKDNLVYIFNSDKNIIYSIAATSVPWAEMTYEDMVSEYVLKPVKDMVSSVEITAGGKIYKFDMETKTNEDEDGNETTETTVKYGDNVLDTSYYDVFFDNLINAQRGGKYEGSAESEAELTVKYNYSNGKESDTVSYFAGESRKYSYSVNGSNDGYVYNTYVSKIISDVKTISENKRVDAA